MSLGAGPDDVTAPEDEEGAALALSHPEIGRYVFRRLVGSGGMGVVVAAHDPELDREVAIKLIVSDRDAAGAPRPSAARSRRAGRPW